MSAAKPAKSTGRSTEPWTQRLIRSLLYGSNVDRAAKARARVGFAMLAFVTIYAVIGGRLVMFAIGADAHSARRAARLRPAEDAASVSFPTRSCAQRCFAQNSPRIFCSFAAASSSAARGSL